MKTTLLRRSVFVPVASFLFCISCTKNDLQSGISTLSSSKSSATIASLFTNDNEFATTVTDSGTTIANYRPGPNNGCDVYTDLYGISHSGNQNYVPELPVNSSSYAGGITTRSFLKFLKLYRFPDSLTIVSAKLYLYPPKDFLNHPQGNTGRNKCVIKRVLTDWTESELTWDNQPQQLTDEDEAFIPPTTNQYGYSPVIDITALVKKWVSGEVPNYGVRITLVNEMPEASVNFASSESINNLSRPTLQIEYK